MIATTRHITLQSKWKYCSILLILVLTACSDYEYSIYDPLSPNYIDKVAPVAEEVDLGLSVNWASWNVGATAPEDYGNYYAWGEVRPRNNYTKDSYIYYNGDGKYTNIGGDICSTSYDVAHVKWGNGWRMPTRDECNELMNKCSWTWTTINGTPGQKISGSNGKSIFLPAAGHISGTKKESLGLYGNYWTGSLILENDDYSHYLYFGLQGYLWSYWQGRFYGFSVRPVRDKKFKDMSIAELLKSGEGTAAIIRGTIVAKHTRGILLNDETGYILVNIEDESGNTRRAASDDATRSAGSYTIGDVVTVEGVVTSDAGLLQFPSTSKIQKVGTADVVYPEPEAWDGSTFYNYFDNISVRYVKYTGVLSKEGNDYIVTVSDLFTTTTAVVQITYPSPELLCEKDEGMNVIVTGYTIGCTDTQKVCTMATLLEIYEKPIKESLIDETAVAEVINLGLSVNWASWNVGATKPEEYGGYYAWGEIDVKNDYSVDTYQYHNGNAYVYIGYNIGTTQYDVANVKWGDDWRMPTWNEIEELNDKCTWLWTSYNGVSGYNIIGPNGNSIFLPAAGFCRDKMVVYPGSCGSYWADEIGGDESTADIFHFNDGGHWLYFWENRVFGNSVRPVTVMNESSIMSIAQLLATGGGTNAKVQATIVATHTRGFLLNDETDYIHVRLDANTDNVVGDVVTVKGDITPWGGLLEFATGATIEKVGTAAVVHPEPVVWDGAALDSYLASPKIQYVQYTGTLSQYDGIYNVTVDGATTAIGSIDCLSTDMVNADWIGKKVTVTGYAYGCNEEKYVSTMATSIEIIEEPNVDMDDYPEDEDWSEL